MDPFADVRHSLQLEKLLNEFMRGEEIKHPTFVDYVNQYLNSDPIDDKITTCLRHMMWRVQNTKSAQLMKEIAKKLGHEYMMRNVKIRMHKPIEIKNFFDYCGADNYNEMLREDSKLGWRHIELAEHFLLNYSSKIRLTHVQVNQLLELGKGLVLNIYPEFLCFYLAKPYKARHDQIAEIIDHVFPQIYKDILDTILSYVLYEKN